MKRLLKVDTARDINWSRLVETLDHFRTNRDFEQIEVPWLVSLDAIRMTHNGPAEPTLQNLYVVGSAEQSFLELDLHGMIHPGKYVSLTPCFRDEPVLSKFTNLHFMKVELYQTVDVEIGNLQYLVNACSLWFEHLAKGTDSEIKIVQTYEGYDINLNGIEVGSYGMRTVNGHSWIYGTALAEPRFSVALNHK